jgi:hypothetical protein
MKKSALVLCLFLIVSCGQTQDEKSKIASVTCSIMGETRNMDAAIRVREINDAREKIGGEPFLEGDDKITESLQYGLCTELVLNDTYEQSLKILKDAERERQRIEAEKRAEEKRIAAENQRIADTKPSVKEEFYPNGQLKLRENRHPKNDGGALHGLYEYYFENGQLGRKSNYKDGKSVGLSVSYQQNGQLDTRVNYKDGKYHGLFEWYWVSTGKLKSRTNYKEGKKDGLAQLYLQNGELRGDLCYRNDEVTDKSYCQN